MPRMPIADQAPYAPTDKVVSVLETYRDTALGGGAIDAATLARMGMGDEIARRVLQTLRLFDLIDEDGKPTANLIGFKQASSDTYKAVLADLLYDVYSPIFAVTGKNLAAKTTTQIEDAFRMYRPDSLRRRMVTLFLGLCQYAGITEDVPKAKPGPKQGRQKLPQHKPKPPAKPPADPPPPPATSEQTDSVTLRSGGQVSLTVSVNLFELSKEDREFVLGLVDKIKGYTGQRMLGAAPAPTNGEDSS